MAAEVSIAVKRSKKTRSNLVVIKKEPKALYGAVGTVVELGITHERVRTV